jgi:hypothetical protein
VGCTSKRKLRVDVNKVLRYFGSGVKALSILKRGTIANMGIGTAQQQPFSHLTSQQEFFCVGKEEKNMVKVGGTLAAIKVKEIR